MCNDGSSDYDCQQLSEIFYNHLFKSDQINNTIEIVYQFLLHHDFNSTAKSLIQEAKKVGVRSLEDPIIMNKSFLVEPNKQILLSYKFGDGIQFFELWDKYIPDYIKTCKEYKILTLKLHVYFVILPKYMLLSIQNSNHDKNIHIKPFMEEDSSFVKMDKQICRIELEKDFNKNMVRLEQYLSTDGKELKHETQLRAFFKLPYVEDPLSDPLFHEIFDKTWSDELFMHLQEFIAKYVQNNRDCEEIDPTKLSEVDTATSILPFKIPDTDSSEKIVVEDNKVIIPNERDIPNFLEKNKSEEQLSTAYVKTHNVESKDSQHHSVEDTDPQTIFKCHHKSVQYNQELALTKSHLYNVHSNYKKLKSRFHKLHGDYHKLISVAAELTMVLENSVKGQPVDLQGMLESCMKIFPDLFNQNIRDELQIKAQQSDDTNIKDIVQPNFNVINISPKLLDFKKIKLHLISGNVKTKLLLLQALRWKITSSQPGECDEAIHEYISSDLLGLHGQIASDNGKSILPYLLIPENVPMPHPLQQSTARLLNTFASLQCGRDYLSMDSSVVEVIFNCLNENCDHEVDALTYDMTLSTLQKLSLRKQQRLYMIESGLLEWLVHHLYNEINTMSFYRLKYATALLMNLSLHKQAQIRISTKASLLISTFIMLLEIDHPSVSPYVKGALNTFLGNDLINNEAKKVNLSSILDQLCKNKTGEMRNYLVHILQVHKRECTIDIEDEAMSDNDNEEFDVLENELDENDPVKNHKSELYGEVLLSTCYMITPDALQKEPPAINKVLQKNTDAKLLLLQKNKQHNKFYSNNCLPLLLEQMPRSMWKEEKERSKHKLQAQKIGTDSEHLSNHHYHFFNSSNNSMLKLLKTKVFLNKNASPYSGSLYIKNQSEFNIVGKNMRNVTCMSKEYNTMKAESNNDLPRTNSKKMCTFKPSFAKKAMTEDVTVYLYENQTSKESSTMTIPSSMTLGSTFENKKGQDQFSSIASLSNVNNDKHGMKFKCDKEEEAFLAKPKISRTPPQLH